MSRSLQQNWKVFSTPIQTFWMSQWLVSLTMNLESFLKLLLSEREISQRKRSLILSLTRFRRIKSLEEVWSLLNRFPRQPVAKYWNESWENKSNSWYTNCTIRIINIVVHVNQHVDHWSFLIISKWGTCIINTAGQIHVPQTK